ncbi:MAG TPA: YdcF family protein [Halomicronema sp.]
MFISKFKKNKKLKIIKLILLLIVSLIATGILTLSFRIALTKILVPEPQVILVLGGDPRRLQFATQFWQNHQKLNLWISDSPELTKFNINIVERIGIPKNKIYFSPATDTVTNFTGIVNDLTKLNLKHLYLITSNSHLPRSRAIATIVLGSRGIIATPIGLHIPLEMQEDRWRTIRDCFRSILWVLTGRTGATFNPRLQSKMTSSTTIKN